MFVYNDVEKFNFGIPTIKIISVLHLESESIILLSSLFSILGKAIQDARETVQLLVPSSSQGCKKS